MNAANKNENIELGMLKKRSEFLYVRDGFYSAKGGVVVQMRKNEASTKGDDGSIRMGFTATKKIGNAVIRNRAKRRLREVARTLLPELGMPGYDYVLIARASTTARNWTDLLDDTRKALITLSNRATGAKGTHKEKSKSQSA